MAIHIYTIRDGKVLEDAVMTDALAIMQQLGLTRKAWPATEQACPDRRSDRWWRRIAGTSVWVFLNPEASREPNFESAFSLRSVRAVIQL